MNSFLMRSFIGLSVLITLHNEQSVEGIIEAVDEASNLILLSDAVVHGVSGKDVAPMRFPRLELTGEQISSIEVLSSVSCDTNSPSLLQSPRRSPGEPLKRPQVVPPNTLSQNKSKHSTPQKTPKKDADWSRDDVRRYKTEEFDFQANLGLFDKKKIFQEIQEMDETRPEDRLVAHNLSQRKMRHDQNVLDRPMTSGEDDDQIVLETTSMSLSEPSSAQSGLKVPCVEAALLASIEQQILLSGILSNEQVIENAGRSLCDFLFDQDQKIFSQTVLLVLSADRIGVYALSAGRHLLNRGYRVEVLPPVDTRLAPGYYNTALRQFGKFGGQHVESVKTKKYSLVLSALPDPPDFRAPVCALVPGVPSAQWHVRFGLPYELPPIGLCVVCDKGWPSNLVDTIIGQPWKYASIFGNSNYSVIRNK